MSHVLSIPILMYHQVTPRAPSAFQKYTVTPRAFAAQMDWLKARGYASVTLEAWLGHRREPSPLPPRPVVITFDDGFRDSVEHAVPVLQGRGFTAIFYLVAALVGRTSRWMAERGLDLPLMDWSDARGLVAQGYQCGSHGMSHSRLAALSATACREELRDSRHRLEDRLGGEVRHLSYPFGSYSDEVRAIAAETGYRSACTVKMGRSTRDEDPFALRRVPVTGQDSLLDFICRLHAGRAPRDLFREGVHRLRHRLRPGRR